MGQGGPVDPFPPSGLPDDEKPTGMYPIKPIFPGDPVPPGGPIFWAKEAWGKFARS